MNKTAFDILVIGGGINGAGIARDAAGRGYSVMMVEKNDLASATSSASTKLIHGGLRYLEYYEFRLVREALQEREVLLRAAPHIIWPLRFVLPHAPHLRPAWLIRLGLFLYDHLGKRNLLPGSEKIDLSSRKEGRPLKSDLKTGFVYSDCWVEDARLVVLNAMDAKERGADVRTRTSFVSAIRGAKGWTATIRDDVTGLTETVTARAIVNAAGPWVSSALSQVTGKNRQSAVRLVKGSHIVVKKLFEGDQAYIFQNADRRIVFAIPYEKDFTLIGTTDLAYDGDPSRVEISREEEDYLLELGGRYFKEPPTRDDIVWRYSGVRPLYNDAEENVSAVTRDYVFDIDQPEGKAPLLSIFGGKITTYRRLAEHAMEKLSALLGDRGNPWTASSVLPGGNIDDADFERFLNGLRTEYPWIPAAVMRRLARAYGTRVRKLIGSANILSGLGKDFGGGVYEAELRYLAENEWARTGEDVLWRRSKLGLHVTDETAKAISDWFQDRYTLKKTGS